MILVGAGGNLSLPSLALFLGRRASGQWDENEQQLHINYKELFAVFFMLKTYYDGTTNAHIQIKADNTTTVACLNRMAIG